MSEVVELRPGTSSALRETEVVPSENVLSGALEAGLDPVIVVGRDRAGELYIARSHCSDVSLALLTRAQVLLAASEDWGLE